MLEPWTHAYSKDRLTSQHDPHSPLPKKIQQLSKLMIEKQTNMIFLKFMDDFSYMMLMSQPYEKLSAEW